MFHLKKIAILLMIFLPPAFSYACDVTPECIRLRAAVDEYYADAISRGQYTRNTQGTYYINEEVIQRFLRNNHQDVETVLRQGIQATRDANDLIREYRMGGTPSHLNELADKIDAATARANKFYQFVHYYGKQGPEGGLASNGILWAKTPQDLRYLDAMAHNVDKFDYLSIERAMGSESKMAALAEKSPEIRTMATSQAADFRIAAADPSNAKSADHFLERAKSIETNVLKGGGAATASKAAARTGTLFGRIIGAFR